MFSLRLTTVLICTLFCLSSLSTQDNWQVLNPLPTNDTGRDIEFINDNEGFVLTWNKLFATDDQGQSWQPKYTFPALSRLVDLNINEDIGFVVGERGAAMKTLDGGASWESIPISTSQDLNAVFVFNDTVIFCGTNRVYRSFDQGITWSSSLTTLGEMETTFFVNPSVGHAGCRNGTILRTTDGGQSWETVLTSTTIPSDFKKIYFVDEHRGFATREHSKLFETSDGGMTWEEFTDTNIPQLGHSIAFTSPEVGYLGGESGALFKTTNGGASWESINFLGAYVYFSALNKVTFLTDEIGFVVGERGRIMKTVDAGLNWEPYALTYLDLNEVSFPSATVGYTADREQLYKSIDGGATWAAIGTPEEDVELGAFYFVNENVGYIFSTAPNPFNSEKEYVYKTTNGGVSWELTNGGNYLDITERLESIYFVNENVGYASGTRLQGTVYRTLSGGNSWNAIAEEGFSKMQFITQNTGYGLDPSGELLKKTTNGGLSWQVVDNLNIDVLDFQFLSADVAYVAGDNGDVVKTIDGGESWIECSLPYEDYEVVSFRDEQEGYLIDGDGYFFHTVNGGDTWEEMDRIFGATDISFSETHVFTSGTFGKLFRLELQPSSTAAEQIANSPEISLFPNPATVAFQLETAALGDVLDIRLFKSSGESLNRSWFKTGENQYRVIPAANYQGIVLVEIITAETTISRKIMLH